MQLKSALAPLLLTSALAAPLQARAENIDVLMNGLFPTSDVTYVGYDSVERVDIPVESGVDRKYLIVDFRLRNEQPYEQLQASIHKACMALLTDRDLISSLSSAGYDMVSVAFDRQSQYDCL